MTDTQPTEGWRERFNEQFKGYLVMTNGAKDLYKPRKAILNFIEQEIATARKEWERELDTKIAEMASYYPVDIFPEPPQGWKKELADFCKQRGYSIDRISAWYARWQEKIARDDIRALLTPKNENE